MWKNHKRFLIVVIIEILLLLGTLPGMLEKSEPVLIYEGAVTEQAYMPMPAQKAGVYRVAAEYTTAEGSVSAVNVLNHDNLYKKTFANSMELRGGNTACSTTYWLTGASDALQAEVIPGEQSGLVLHSLTVERTNQGATAAAAVILLFSLLADGFVIWWNRMSLREDAAMIKWSALGVGIIALVASLPLLADYCMTGEELHFHLLRIEGLKEGLLSGQFPVRVQPNWFGGEGYAVSVFEGDLFLLLPALLRMAGIPVQTAYQWTVLLYQLAGTILAYGVFAKLFRDRICGLVGSMLCMWSPYRLDALYAKADLGESIAILFLPMVLYGIWAIIHQQEEKQYGRVWLIPAIGFAAMFQAHITTFEIALLMVLLLCVGTRRKAFSKKGLWALCKTALGTLVFSAWMLVPLFDYLINKDMWIKCVGANPIQRKGIYWLHLFTTFFWNGDSRDLMERRIQNTAATGMGFALLCVVLLYAWVCFTGRYRQERKNSEMWKCAAIACGVGAVLLVMSTSYFPWDAIRSLRVMQILTAGLKSPAECLPAAVVCLSFVACALVWQFRKSEGNTAVAYLLVGLLAVSFVTTQFLVGDFLRNRGVERIYAGEFLNTGEALGGEYLMLDTAEGERGERIDESPWYWRVSEAVSVCGVLVTGVMFMAGCGKDRKKEEDYVEKI